MNTYATSDGQRFKQSQIESKIKEAKASVLQNQIDKYNYNFCEQCGCNSSNTRLDCSHDISVKKAKENGKTEECWNIKNIVIRCRKCHQKLDGLDLKFNK